MKGMTVRSRALWAVAALTLVSGCSRFDARMQLRKGNSAYRGKQFDVAVAHYSQIAQGVPERVHAELNTGYAHMAQYKWGSHHPKDRELAEKAVAAFESYLKLRPADAPNDTYPPEPEIEERIVSLLIDSERYQQAIDRLQKKLQSDPGNAAVLGGLAEAYDRWGKPVLVLSYRQQQARLFPDQTSRQSSIAAYCWKRSHYQGPEMAPLERNRWVDTGLAAAEATLKVDAKSIDGLTYKNLLLRERAKLRTDPDQAAALVREASEILLRVNDMRKKQKEDEDAAKAKAKAATASPTPGKRG